MLLGGIQKDIYNNCDSAFHYFFLADDIFTSINNQFTIAQVNEIISQLYAKLGEYDKALERINRSVSICQGTAAPGSCRSILYTKAYHLYDIGQLDSAQYYLKLSLARATEIGDLPMQENNLIFLSYIEEDKTNYKESLELFMKSTEVRANIY